MPRLETQIKELRQSGDPSRAFTVHMFPPPKDRLLTTQREYRYKLNSPPRQKEDHLVQMIVKAIRHLSRTPMVFAAANFWPHNLDSTIPLWPGHAGGATRLYAFTQDFEEFPLTAEVTIARGTTKLTIDSILIRKKFKEHDARRQLWKPINAWLLDLPIPWQLSEGTTRAGVPRAVRVQQTWWNKNGKYFPLMKLPAELRSIIFQQVLGENFYPRARQNFGLSIHEVTLSSSRTILDFERDARLEGSRPCPPNYSILDLNKQVRKEALQAGWEGTWKHLVRPLDIENVVDAPNAPFSGEWLGRVHLNFSMDQYLSFLGVHVVPQVRLVAPVRNSHPLKSIKGLKRLELFFPDPYGGSADSNPWSIFHLGHRHEQWFRDDEDFANMPSRPCQTVIIDWIMTLAFSIIKEIPKVQLSGSVKKHTKEKWHYILEREYRERKLEYRTHGYDHADVMDSIIGTPVYATPACHCPASCVHQPDGLDAFDYNDEHTANKTKYSSTTAMDSSANLPDQQQFDSTEDSTPSVVRPGVL